MRPFTGRPRRLAAVLGLRFGDILGRDPPTSPNLHICYSETRENVWWAIVACSVGMD